MEYEKQIKMIENGKQIAYKDYHDKSGTECAIQKKGMLYLIYICTHDFEYDAMGTGKEEYHTYEKLDNAIAYIISRGFHFDQFYPQKGNQLFNPDFFDYISCNQG